jgi:chromosome segregation ATPase
MADSKFNVDSSDDFHQKEMQMIDSSGGTPKEGFNKEVALTEIHDLNEAGGDPKQDFSELEALTSRINELVANILRRETRFKDELATKKENLASITASLENSNKEIAEMRATNEKKQSLIAELSSLVAEQEMQLQNLKEVIGTKEQVITSFAVSLENSKKEIAELHKKVDEMKAKNSLTGLLTNQQSESQAKENSVQKAEPKATEEKSGLKSDRKAQMKMLKKLLKMNPNAEEKVLAELLGVDSSYITGLRKELID